MRQRILIIPLVLAVCLMSVRWAFGADDTDTWLGVPAVVTDIILIVTFVGVVVTTIYGVWNRSSYATREATIKDLNALLEARDAVIVERERSLREAAEKHTAQIEALTAKNELEIKGLQAEIRRLTISNEAVTGANFIAIGELAKLREQGLWKGHERDIYEQAGLYASGDKDGRGHDDNE